LIPDQVPAEQRGIASGWIGLMAMLGVIAGSLAASRMVKEGDLASFGRLYTLIVVVMVVFTLTTVLVLREEPLQRTTPLDARAILRHFKFDPRAYPDFIWVFVTRALVMMGYFTVLDFLYYYVRDELGRNGASAGVLQISSAVVVAAALTVFFAGWISDRVGRKAVVYASAGMMAVVSLAFIVTHTLGVAVIVGALWGLGWGAYQSVDWALATDVLPRPDKADGATSFARYMGIWSLAITLPQVVAPAIGPLIQLVNDHTGQGGYTLMFCLVFVYFLLGAVLVRNVRATR
jgi:MFS family permease